jgi:hypothetical protein
MTHFRKIKCLTVSFFLDFQVHIFQVSIVSSKQNKSSCFFSNLFNSFFFFKTTPDGVKWLLRASKNNERSSFLYRYLTVIDEKL